jgi:hypothetical protein
MRKVLVSLLLALTALPALAQPGQGRQSPHERRMERQIQRPMPAPERRMSYEDRERLREQVRGGQMTRDQAREQYREERARRALEPGRSPEDREKLRRDVMEANRALERR